MLIFISPNTHAHTHNTRQTETALLSTRPHPRTALSVMTWWSSANPTGHPPGSGLTHVCSILTVISLMSCYAAATSVSPRPLLHAHKHQTVRLTSHQTDSPTSLGLLLHLPLQSFYPLLSVCLLGFLACLDSSLARYSTTPKSLACWLTSLVC